MGYKWENQSRGVEVASLAPLDKKAQLGEQTTLEIRKRSSLAKWMPQLPCL